MPGGAGPHSMETEPRPTVPKQIFTSRSLRQFRALSKFKEAALRTQLINLAAVTELCQSGITAACTTGRTLPRYCLLHSMAHCDKWSQVFVTRNHLEASELRFGEGRWFIVPASHSETQPQMRKYCFAKCYPMIPGHYRRQLCPGKYHSNYRWY